MFTLRMPFSCQEWSHLRSKWANWISNYVVIGFVHTQRNHSVKNGIFTKDLHFYAPGKIIHSQVKYIIMDYFDQKKQRNLDTQLVYLKVTDKLLVLWHHAFILCYGSLRMNGNKDSHQLAIERRLAFQQQ